MSARNRLRLLSDYVARRTVVRGRPVEFIVETTGRCNLYCPMCPRETTKPPNRDMSDEVFSAFVEQASGTAEAAMLIGLGEPLLDRKIFDRIERCRAGHIAALVSTNGTLLDERAAGRLLDTGVDHVILSFDGATKETYEHYRKGAQFESVRDNFVRFARMKHARRSRTHVTVQMILMERSRPEVEAFVAWWSEIPGVDAVRIKEDETSALGEKRHDASTRAWPCHYLWRGPMYVKLDGDVHPCHPAATMGAEPIGNLLESSVDEIWNGDEARRMRELHVAGRSGELDACRRCSATIAHPLLAAGSLLLHGKTVRDWIPRVERVAYAASSLPIRLLRPPRRS